MMSFKRNQEVINDYKKEERMVVLLFAQWCINHDLDPLDVYKEAYPNQFPSEVLQDVLQDTVPKEVSEEIPIETLSQALHAFGHDELVFLCHQKKNGI